MKHTTGDGYIGAIDQGTTSTRFTLFDAQGQLCGFDQAEHRQYYPQPGWVEHDAMEIVDKTRALIVAVLAKSGVTAKSLHAIGITNQRETTVLWDRRTGKPISPAIVWQDVRTAEYCRGMSTLHGPFVHARTGLPIATYFSASKIRWILENVANARSLAAAGDLLFGTIDSWLIWNLSGGPSGGVHVIDATNASRTLLMNLETLSWDPELLALFDIPPSILPEIRSSSEVYAHTTIDSVAVPLASAIGDQQAALFGQACFNVGQIKNTYGTGCFLLMHTGTELVRSHHGLLTTLACRLPGQPVAYALEGSVAMAGASVQWLRDNLGLIQSSAEVETLASEVADNGDVYFVPAFSGLFAPYWRSDARGILAGLTRYARRGHIARAVLESTAFQTRDVIEAMIKDTGIALTELKVDGGMTSNSLLMQMQSDILDVPVVRPKVSETTALGAAYAAGLAVGFWSDLEELRGHWVEARRWMPAMHPELRNRLWTSWHRAVEKSLGWVQDQP